ncbi:MAG: O-antigen ligase family protein [Candidatus Promineifilaceae bacterium]|nr:O-antigen ligase family protein [Candidatus Promineifilaceae bacterium]
MNSKLAQWCDGLIEAGLLAAIILSPLFFNIHSDRVFEPDKLTLVRSIAVLMSGAWLVKFIDARGWENVSWLRWGSKRSIWRLPFVLPIFLLVIVYLVSTVFSVTPRVSWAGSYQRLQGTYTTLSYIVIFALAAATIRRRDQINRLVTTVIITSIPISLYALLQHYNLDPLPWGGNVQRRVAGHMGNAIFIAAYLIMAVPLTASRIIDAFTNILGDEELSYSDVVRSSVYIFTLAIQLVAIYWSQSRGPLLGLLVGMFAFVLILLVSLRNAEIERRPFGMQDALRAVAMVALGIGVGFIILLLLLNGLAGSVDALSGAMPSFLAFVGAVGLTAIVIFIMVAAGRGWRWLWLSWILLAVFLAGWLVAFNLPEEVAEPYMDEPVTGGLLTTLADWRELPTVGRFGQLLEAESGTGRVRVLIWQGTLELLKPHEPIAFPDGEEDAFNFLRPVIGYGPESMYVAYNRFYVPELATIEARNASPDRAHNETFDALVITGLLGFLVWQALYVSVFYYGFRWLGVVRSRRDRNVLIGLWIVGAALSAVFLTQWLGAVFIGVAIPFGSIGGLVLYLIYYALFASAGEATEIEVENPFSVDRLLMLGLLGAVLAHFVEIHFGIAIASTRVHFFVYVALMFLVGHLLPGYQEEAAEAQRVRRKGRRRRLHLAQPGWTSAVFAATFVLTLILGTLGYEFMNYARPPELVVSTVEDVPTPGDIVHQAFFVHPGKGFAPSPFIFLMIVLSWALGTLALLSELAKQGILQVKQTTVDRLQGDEMRNAAVVFVGLLMMGPALRYLRPPENPASTSSLLGILLLLSWGLLCLFAAWRLLQEHEAARRTAGIVAAVGLAFSLPTMTAGAGLYGFLLLVGCALNLYLLWDSSWNSYLLPGLVLSLFSLAIAFGYAYLQASQIRSAIFFGPQTQTQVSEIQRILLTTDMFARFLTVFYAFVIGLMLVAAFVLGRRFAGRANNWGTTAGIVSAVVIFPLALFLIQTTNLRIIQADVVYKQARPLDQQASRSGNPRQWDAPIAIYGHAIDLAPNEDFYYLFLGRAYLEKSGVVENPEERRQLLETARERLLVAQEINPLNTDHTANLARLTTRWASLRNLEPARREELLAQAKDYYQDALSLSPQNSVIRNEYANMLFSLEEDCDAALATYERSLEIDPFFADTYFNLAGVYQNCAAQADQETQQDYYLQAAQLLEQGLERQPRNPNASALLVQAGQLYQQAGEYDAAIAALEEAQQAGNEQVAGWQIDFQMAGVYLAMGNRARAEELANQALAVAPSEAQTQIQDFLDTMGSQ